MENKVTLLPEDDPRSGATTSLLERVERGPLVIDIARLPYLSTAALSALARLRRRLPHELITLRGASPVARRVLRVVGFERYFRLEDDGAPGVA